MKNSLLSSVQERFSTLRLSNKLLILVLFIFLLLVLLVLAYILFDFRAQTQLREFEAISKTEEVILAELSLSRNFALGLALQAAQSPDIQAALAARDRAALQALTLDSFYALREQLGVRQYHFHIPPAQSFLRLHNLTSFGDDLSSIRETVVQVNQTRQPVAGIEVGLGGLGIRGVVPVFYQGNHIGSVEVGLNMDKGFVENLKTIYGDNWRILLVRDALASLPPEEINALQTGPTPDLLVLADTLPGLYQPVDAYAKVLAETSSASQVRAENGQFFIISAIPLRDFKGRVIGVVERIANNTDVLNAQTNRFVLLATGLLVVAFVGVFSLTQFTNRLLIPLRMLNDAALHVQQGDFNQKVSVFSKDELGVLAETFNSMTAQIRDLFAILEQRVAERTKALQTSLEVSRRLSGATDPRQLAVDVVEQLQAAFGYYHAHIYYQDEATGDLVMAGGTGQAGAAMLAAGHRIPQGRGLVGRAAETRAPVLVPDVSQAIGWLPNPLLPETQSEAAVPILAGDRVLGVLDVQQNRINGLTEEDVMLLQAIASQVAISLQTARAYQASAERAEMEAAVNYLAQRIQRASSVQETLQTAIREAAQVLGAKRISVKLVSPSGRKS